MRPGVHAIRPTALICVLAVMIGCAGSSVVDDSVAPAPTQTTVAAGVEAPTAAAPTPRASPAASADAPTVTAEPTAMPDPTAVPISASDLPARARFDRIVLDLYAEAGDTAGPMRFHGAALTWCGRRVGATALTESDRSTFGAALSPDICELVRDHSESEPTGLATWRAIVDLRWSRVVWWEDKDSFEADLAAMCRAERASDLRLDGFSLSANDEYLAVRSTGECRYLDAPAETADPARPSEPIQLEGTLLVRIDHRLLTVDLATGEETTIIETDGPIRQVALSPTLDAIALAVEDPIDDDHEHLSIVRDGACHHVATIDGGYEGLAWSPDGDRFASVVWDRSADTRVELVDRSGSARIVAAGGYLGKLPTRPWIDSSTLVFALNPPASPIQWQVRDVDADEATLVSRAIGFPAGAVSPDGTTLVFASEDELYVVEALDQVALEPWPSTDLFPDALHDPGALPTLPAGPGGERGLMISPDSSRLLFESTAGILTVTGVHVMDLPTGAVSPLADTTVLRPGEILQGVGVWSPTGHAAIIELDGGSATPDRNVAVGLGGTRVDLVVEGRIIAWVDRPFAAGAAATCVRPATD